MDYRIGVELFLYNFKNRIENKHMHTYNSIHESSNFVSIKNNFGFDGFKVIKKTKLYSAAYVSYELKTKCHEKNVEIHFPCK